MGWTPPPPHTGVDAPQCRVCCGVFQGSCRGAPDAWSRLYLYSHTTKICGVECGVLHKGEMCEAIRWPKAQFYGEVFWARGYFVSTVGLDEEIVLAYIRNQEKRMNESSKLNLECELPPSGGAWISPFEGLTENKSPALPGVISSTRAARFSTNNSKRNIYK